MSDRNDLISLILGGVIVYLFLYFTGKIIGTAPANEKEEMAAAPGATCGACNSAVPAVSQPQAENPIEEGRYIVATAVPSTSIIN